MRDLYQHLLQFQWSVFLEVPMMHHQFHQNLQQSHLREKKL
jgi:hypothetical protein